MSGTESFAGGGSTPLHEALESLALRHATVSMEISEGGGLIRRIVRIEDIVTRNRQRFLKALDQGSGAAMLIRLDAIRNFLNLAEWQPDPPTFC